MTPGGTDPKVYPCGRAGGCHLSPVGGAGAGAWGTWGVLGALGLAPCPEPGAGPVGLLELLAGGLLAGGFWTGWTGASSFSRGLLTTLENCRVASTGGAGGGSGREGRG